MDRKILIALESNGWVKKPGFEGVFVLADEPMRQRNVDWVSTDSGEVEEMIKLAQQVKVV